MTAREISDATFETEVLQSSEPVLVDFFATWCGPCKAMAPVLDAVALELRGKVKVVKVDVGANPEAAKTWSVQAVPTLMVFKNGTPVARNMGALIRKDVLLKWVTDWAESEASDVEPRVSGWKLTNGMDVVVIHEKHAPMISHMIWYKVGAADAPEGRSGLAKLVERLTLNSLCKAGLADAPSTPRSSYFADSPFGYDATVYSSWIAQDELKAAMEVEVDRMTHLRLTDEDVAVAIEAFESAGAQTDSAVPSRVRLHVQMTAEMNSLLFSAHPYRVPMMGWPDERRALSREDVLRFYERHYAPNNAVLVVAGGLTPEAVRQLAEETYGKVPAKADLPDRSRRKEPQQVAARRVVLKDKDVPRHTLRRIYATPSYATAKAGEIEALQLLGRILGGGRSGRLGQLVGEGEPMLGAGADFRADARDFGMVTVYVEANGVEVDAAEEKLDAVLDDLRRNGVTELELEHAKTELKAAFVATSDDHEKCARRYGQALALGRTLAEVEGWPDAIAKVTVEDVVRVAREYLDLRRSVTGWLIPDQTGESFAGNEAA